MSTAPSTREKIVEAAKELFWTRGYEATGLKDILAAAQVNSGSLYYFFKSKQDLLLAVLDWYFGNLHPQVMDPAFAQTDDPIERIFAVMAGYRMHLTLLHFERGCPIGNLALELASGPEQVREKIAANFVQWREAIEACLAAAAERLPAGLDRKAMAQFVLTVMEGAVMQSRAHRSIEPFDACIAQLRDYFNRLERKE